MSNLDIKIKLANTLATLLLISSQSFRFFRILDSTSDVTSEKYLLILLGLLHVLLVGFTVYQFLPRAAKDVYLGINYWYLVIALIDGAVSSLMFFHMTLLAFGVLLWQLAVLLFIYHRLEDYPPRNHVDSALVNIPFSIFTSFTFICALNLLFNLFVPTQYAEKAQVVFIIVAGFTALHLVDYSHRQDWAFALTTAWMLLGFYSLQPTAYTISLITVGILISAAARARIPHMINRAHRQFGYWSHRIGERTPLL